ncbi:GrpB family protein [Paractinoplanes lichenicola]|uniref:GrpB family protein n=1 Tax=Paractinoplanes lichenicola TaxID=2802976 RepID=A0ABS1VY81_9ACTN|nr:GrpB family protein [Actinoplanes lichenicola]MBL7259461.1 GrpB family protein [Actinoplanes lichenicola]
MTIEIRDYDPSWPARAAQALDEAFAALGDTITVAEHVGSTSVPGLPAKPIIDLMAAAPSLDAVRDREAALSALGYDYVDAHMPRRLLYRRPGYHLHIVTADTWETRNQRILRDHLRTNEQDRDAYAALKRELAATAPDGDAYTEGKTALIQQIMDRARAARGLPPVDVWEAG